MHERRIERTDQNRERGWETMKKERKVKESIYIISLSVNYEI